MVNGYKIVYELWARTTEEDSMCCEQVLRTILNKKATADLHYEVIRRENGIEYDWNLNNLNPCELRKSFTVRKKIYETLYGK